MRRVRVSVVVLFKSNIKVWRINLIQQSKKLSTVKREKKSKKKKLEHIKTVPT